jgi:hypothetical protein
MHEPQQQVFLLLRLLTGKAIFAQRVSNLGLLQILHQFLSELDRHTIHSFIRRTTQPLALCLFKPRAASTRRPLPPTSCELLFCGRAKPSDALARFVRRLRAGVSSATIQVWLAPLAEVEHVVANVAVLALEVAVPAGALVGLQVPVTKREGGRRQKVERECCVTTQDSFAYVLVRTLPRWGSSSA